MTRKSSEVVKKRRKKLRAIKKGYLDNEKENEKVDSYSGCLCYMHRCFCWSMQASTAMIHQEPQD